ncbi:MAG: 3'-5' exonuclease [Nitrospirae bacterium]|nr:3'-5' exonuclease [Nitrospirota bacterium]NTW68170.1 3'-5' exonuclease [Nitrospirota bacterium]
MNDLMGLFMRRPAANTGVDLAAPIEAARYVVMDTELTGLDSKKDSIISVGAVVMQGGRIILGEIFYEMVSPETAMRSESVVVHGITPSEVANKPDIGAVLEDFLKFCKGAVVVGHFLSLDLGFLNKEMKRLYGTRFPQPVADTMQMNDWVQDHDTGFRRNYGSTEENKDLFSMAKKYHIPVAAAHNALMDAFITAQLFQRYLSSLPALGVRTVKDLLRIAKP